MITLYKGRRGSGKTLTMVKDAYFRYHKNGWKIYSNLYLDFAELLSSEDIVSIDTFSNFNNSVLVIDEIEVFFDSRSWKKEEAKKFSHFLQQIRKRNVHILCTAQYTSLVDVRIRQQIDRLALPDFNKRSSFCSVHYFDLTSLESGNKPSFFRSSYKPHYIYALYDTDQMITLV